MADVKNLYANSGNTVALTFGVEGLASGAPGVYTAGRQSTAVSNATDLDLDHLVSGKVRVGASGLAAGRQIVVWAYAPRKIASGTPTYPDTITGTDGAVTLTSANTLNAALVWLHTITIASTGGVDYEMPPRSIRQAFGWLPNRWGLYLAHDTGAALDADAADHEFHYLRVQSQVG